MSKKLIIGAGIEGQLLQKKMQEYAEDFRNQRIVQYGKDRTDALRRLDVQSWRAFSLRWNICPAFPHGWGTDDETLAIMHKTRLMLGNEFSTEERKFSAAHLIANGLALPDGLEFIDGEVRGEVKQPAPQP